MSHTTRPPIVDIAEEIPSLADYARTAVRLHPRRGNPGTGDSHIGGPLLWPADEPWPYCHGQGAPKWELPHTELVALAPIAQLYASDIPDFPFPEDADLLQILWCPAHDMATPAQAICVRWRRAAEVTAVLTDPPAPHLFEEVAMPTPCTVDPEPITEYPYSEELPLTIQDEIRRWENSYPAHSTYLNALSTSWGCKMGGGMSWEVTDMGEHPTCDVCGSQAHLILQLESTEWGGKPGHEGGPRRWQPIEDTNLDGDAYWEALEPTGLTIGRYSHGGFYGCSTDHHHPVVFYIQ